MKIGIMSMQRIINYGSFLQSYSLKRNLESMGAEVCMVDYHVEKPLVHHKAPKKNKNIFSKASQKVVDILNNHIIFPKRISVPEIQENFVLEDKINKLYKEEMLPLLGVTQEPNYQPELDVLVIGSDEVFNCLQPNPAVGYSRELFGKNNRAKKIISYAASFGNTGKEGLEKYGVYEEVKEMLEQFDAVSLRDSNSIAIARDMGLQNIVKNVDPVFLYDYTDETKIDVPFENYIVVYSYSYRISKKESAAIIRFAKKHNKKIVCIEGHQPYLSGYVALNPFETLAYFKKADYIVTDTFHGTVFSIKNNKKFASLVRGGREHSYGNSEKLRDLLKTFGLEDRELVNVKNLEKTLLNEIDYESVNKRIAQEKKKALEYLKNYAVC